MLPETLAFGLISRRLAAAIAAALVVLTLCVALPGQATAGAPWVPCGTTRIQGQFIYYHNCRNYDVKVNVYGSGAWYSVCAPHGGRLLKLDRGSAASIKPTFVTCVY